MANNEDKEAVKRQHAKGKLTARERINMLLDKNTFVELNELVELKSNNYNLQEKKKAGDGVITGYGKINNRPVCIYAQDFTFMGGSMGEMHNLKIASIMEHALKTGCPIIGLFDSGGARIQEGIHGLDTGGIIFKNNTLASGVIPQISVILGPCAGIAVYSPALTDFVFMTKKISYMFITGPDVIKSITGETIDFDGLGGSLAHNEKSGVADFIAENEKECFDMIKLLLSYLPQNNLENPVLIGTNDNPERLNNKLKNLIPKDSKKTYDVKDVIEEVVDKNTFFEIHQLYAQNVVIGLARLNNNVVGIVANQPKILAGCLDINGSNKIARFVRFCDSFNIPLINLVDVTGYLPGVEQEHNGIIKHGAKVLYAYSEATVPKISLVMRKAYGGAYIAMVSKDMGFDKVIAWPDTEIAVMGADQAINIIHRKELKGKNAEKIRKEKVKSYKEKFLNPYEAATHGKVDIITNPKNTRKTLISCLEMLMNKREKRPSKKHGNIPL
ncbi:MAG: acyl-CoA carboxylase subunit beta [Candidatus Woesearchaeota archaeon]|jgi:acetyl-CoA carboxylase carboxyltransferase component|nr:acyl-CoA carboxylase subunit beta [Candidatus Woesearchaeota archaeon]MDP7623053.1 acyl-CoA carboxylase subunit beta [Candidatus Woesearchaeota archaeon]HJN56733.1 acyl-CoA carboxylase subunit beta [Candidatus Woesearchaeota archaeon]|tara:strand:+ start:17845 stop:19344 length:1500 start_codon:yes stop_codon:yes gene_type:complete